MTGLQVELILDLLLDDGRVKVAPIIPADCVESRIESIPVLHVMQESGHDVHHWSRPLAAAAFAGGSR